MAYEIIFTDLGRRKVSGKAIIKELNYPCLNKIFKNFYGSTLDFTVNDKTGEGTINFGWYSQPFKFRKIEGEE